jgi:hypothetical protein
MPPPAFLHRAGLAGTLARWHQPLLANRTLTIDTWLAKRLDYLRELKAPSATQKLLLALASKPALSAREQRELDALTRLEKINDRAAQAKIKAHKILRAKDDDDRKARNHRLIMQGALIDLAQLDQVDRGVLLGGLLSLASQLEQPSADLQARWKAQGDAMLAQKESSARRAGTSPRAMPKGFLS